MKWFFVLFLFCNHCYAQQDSLSVVKWARNRSIVKSPDFSGIKSEENCVIFLEFYINNEGVIVGNPTFLKDKTTTTNLELIREVIQRFKEGARYLPSENLLEKGMIVIRINGGENVP